MCSAVYWGQSPINWATRPLCSLSHAGTRPISKVRAHTHDTHSDRVYCIYTADTSTLSSHRTAPHAPSSLKYAIGSHQTRRRKNKFHNSIRLSRFCFFLSLSLSLSLSVIRGQALTTNQKQFQRIECSAFLSLPKTKTKKKPENSCEKFDN